MTNRIAEDPRHGHHDLLADRALPESRETVHGTGWRRQPARTRGARAGCRDDQKERTDIGSRTAWADFSSAARSSAVSSISSTFSSPLRPSLQGTPRNKPESPYSPSSHAAHGRMRLRSLHDRLDHLHRAGRRRIVRRAGLEVLHDLGAAVARALHDRVELLARHELRHRDPADRRVGDERHHRVAVPAEHHRLDVAHRHVERLGEERAVARRIEHTGHADDALAREARHVLRDVAHHVERVRDHDDDRVRRGGA